MPVKLQFSLLSCITSHGASPTTKGDGNHHPHVCRAGAPQPQECPSHSEASRGLPWEAPWAACWRSAPPVCEGDALCCQADSFSTTARLQEELGISPSVPRPSPWGRDTEGLAGGTAELHLEEAWAWGSDMAREGTGLQDKARTGQAWRPAEKWDQGGKDSHSGLTSAMGLQAEQPRCDRWTASHRNHTFGSSV